MKHRFKSKTEAYFPKEAQTEHVSCTQRSISKPTFYTPERKTSAQQPARCVSRISHVLLNKHISIHVARRQAAPAATMQTRSSESSASAFRKSHNDSPARRVGLNKPALCTQWWLFEMAFGSQKPTV